MKLESVKYEIKRKNMAVPTKKNTDGKQVMLYSEELKLKPHMNNK